MTEFPDNPIPIGSRVRWNAKYNRSDWEGVVTAHTSPKSVECDGKGSIANSLLEVVTEPEASPILPAPEAPPVDPRDELIAQQCELIAELQVHEAWRAEGCDALVDALCDPDKPLSETINWLADQIPDEDEADRVKEMEAFQERLEAALEAYLSETHGASRPAHIPSPELRALAALIYEGV